MKKILMLITLMSLVFLAACGNSQVAEEKQVANPYLANVEIYEFTSQPEMETNNEVLAGQEDVTEHSDVIYCAQIENKFVRDNCFSNTHYIKAVAAKSTPFCMKLDDNYRRNECLTYVQAGNVVIQ